MTAAIVKLYIFYLQVIFSLITFAFVEYNRGESLPAGKLEQFTKATKLIL